jgi:hypothetical protein
MLCNAITVTVFSSIPGIDAMLQKFLRDVLVDFICNHNDFRIFSNTLANAGSSLLYTEPLGLQGELNHIILVFWCDGCWLGRCDLKSFSIDVGTNR